VTLCWDWAAQPLLKELTALLDELSFCVDVQNKTQQLAQQLQGNYYTEIQIESFANQDLCLNPGMTAKQWAA